MSLKETLNCAFLLDPYSVGIASGKDGLYCMDQSRLEFLVTCIDIAVYKTITGAVQRIHGAINYTSTTATARAYIARRKIDGIFLDMALEGSAELVQSVRRGSSNRYAVIFACAGA